MKRVAVFLLIAIFCISIIGCTQKPTEGIIEDTSEEKAQREVIEVDGGLKIPKIDLQNKTLKFLGLDFPQWREDGTARKFFKDTYGGEIEVTISNASELYTVLAAEILSNASPDIVTAFGGFPGLVINDTIQPVDGLIDFSLDINKGMQSVYEQFAINSKHYFLPWVITTNQYIYYNTKMFENNSLESPRKLFDEGKWDWAAFSSYASELTVDENGDGTPEIWGAGMCTYQDARFIFTTGENLFKMQDGKLTSNLKSANISRAAGFLADMTLKSKSADPNRDINHVIESFNSGLSAMVIGPSFWHGTDSVFTDIKKAKQFDLVPLPKDPDADSYYVDASNIGFYIPVGAMNKQASEAFLYSCIASQKQLQIEGSANYNKELQKYLDNWSEFGYSEEDYIARNEFIIYMDQNLSLITDPYSGILDVSVGLYEKLLGTNESAPLSYEQIVAETEPGVLEAIEQMYALVD